MKGRAMSDFREDLKRYRNRKTGKFDWNEPSLLVVALYRWGRWIRSLRFAPLRFLLNCIFVPVYGFATCFIGISLPRSAKIGGGLRIDHFGAIVIGPGVVIGKHCTIRQGVTIGNRKSLDDMPVLGDDVNIGAGAKILGAVRIGNGAKIGANAVVLSDVPEDATAVGVPARIVHSGITSS